MADISKDWRDKLESLVTEYLNENDVPGASVVIVDEEGERYAEGFGSRDLEANAPATPDTLYGMGSISKSFTALAVIQLAESGVLSVADPVNEYVGHYEGAPGDPITIEELLTHTSGMPATPTGAFDQAFEGFPSGVADEADLKRFVRDSTEFRGTDQEHFFYYNTGYVLLGKIIEAVDGRPYAEYVSEEIFEPLDLERATFDSEVLAADDDAMTGHRPGEGEEPPEPTEFPLPDLDQPAGGLIASVRDLSRFLRAMMTDGELAGNRVCSANTVERLQQGRVVRQSYLDGTDQEYCYGWQRQPLGSTEVIGHGGSILVSTSYAGYLPDEGIGVVVACNSSAEPHASSLGQAALALVNEQDVTEVPAYALKEKCEAVSGTYEAFRAEFTVSVEPLDGGLLVTYESHLGEDEFRAFPASLDPDDHEFYTVTGGGVRAPLEFDLDGEQAHLCFRRTRVRRTAPGA